MCVRRMNWSLADATSNWLHRSSPRSIGTWHGVQTSTVDLRITCSSQRERKRSPDQQADLVPADLPRHEPKRPPTDAIRYLLQLGADGLELAAHTRLQLDAVQEYQFAFGQQLDRER